MVQFHNRAITRLAQSVERQTFNLVVGGSSPPSGAKNTIWTYGLMVMTAGFGPANLGSIPGMSFLQLN
jgi:hypothetical protein